MLGINSNLDDISAGIGTIQIKKLDKIIKKLILGEYIKKQLKLSKTMKVGYQIPGSHCVYWFVRIHLNLDKITASKKLFCKVLMAEVFQWQKITIITPLSMIGINQISLNHY